MKYLPNMALAALLALGLPASSAGAQTNESSSAKKSSSGDAGAQFDQAGKRLGEGAEHVGEGIKDGAIQVWEAVKAGAQAVRRQVQQQAVGGPGENAPERQRVSV